MNDVDLSSLDAATDAKTKSIAFDVEIITDLLKFSLWLAAFGSGGLAVLVTARDKLLTSIPNQQDSHAVLLTATIVLFASILATAAAHFSANLVLAAKRQKMTLVLRQKVEIIETFRNETMVQLDADKVITMLYLQPSMKQRFDECDQLDDRATTTLILLILTQTLLVLIGYFLILLRSTGYA